MIKLFRVLLDQKYELVEGWKRLSLQVWGRAVS